jgi:hypothetical protein
VRRLRIGILQIRQRSQAYTQHGEAGADFQSVECTDHADGNAQPDQDNAATKMGWRGRRCPLAAKISPPITPPPPFTANVW